MIDVEYRPKTLFGSAIVTPELQAYFEKVINAWVDSFRQYLCLSRLQGIVITDNFINDVLDFQKNQQYQNPRVTNNENARAFGKTLLDKKTNKYVVFLDAEYGNMLLGDNFFEEVLSSFDDKQYVKNMKALRQMAINLLAHELSHIEFETLTNEPSFPATYDGELRFTSWLLVNEYYAARSAAHFESHSINLSAKEALIETEEIIGRERKKYNLREISLNEFAALFIEYTRLALIYGVSVIAESRGSNSDIPEFDSCNFTIAAKELTNLLDTEYKAVKSGAGEIKCQAISDAVIKYHESFDVFITDTTDGICFNIPPRL